MGKIYEEVMMFKARYPFTVAWRLKQNASIVEKYINPDEEALYSFVAQKNDSPLDFFSTAVITLTNKRILIGRKRVFLGYFLNSITPDLYNDLKVHSGILWGKIIIDTVKEIVVLSNLEKESLDEIETKISSFMMEAKKEYKVIDE